MRDDCGGSGGDDAGRSGVTAGKGFLLPTENVEPHPAVSAQFLDGRDALRVGPRLRRPLHVGDVGVAEGEQVVHRLTKAVLRVGHHAVAVIGQPVHQYERRVAGQLDNVAGGQPRGAHDQRVDASL